MFKIKEYEDLYEYVTTNIIHLGCIPACFMYLIRCSNLTAICIGFLADFIYVGFLLLLVLQYVIGGEAANSVIGKITRCRFIGVR